jgi:hypothetical protein
LRRFLFGKFMGALLMILGFILLGCLVGLIVGGACSTQEVSGAADQAG